MSCCLQINDADMQATLIPVGQNITFTADSGGELICFANDAEGLYGDNRAYLNVTVTRGSWPPDDSFPAEYQAYLANASHTYL